MDKALIRARFAKAAHTYLPHAEVQAKVAEHLMRLVRTYVPASAHKRVTEIGCGTGLFSRMYLQACRPEHLLLNDLCPEVEPCLSDVLNERVTFKAADAETLDFPSGQDLILSCSALQWFDDPERFLCGCKCLLAEKGYLAVGTYGKRNVCELDGLVPETLPYRSLDEWLLPLRDEYDIVCQEEEQMQLTFASPLEVLRHLKATGVTGIRTCSWTKGQLAAFCQAYTQRHAAPNGEVSLTYHPLYIIMRKK